MKPKVMVFQGKNMKGIKTKYFFYTKFKEMYSTMNLTSILHRINKMQEEF